MARDRPRRRPPARDPDRPVTGSAPAVLAVAHRGDPYVERENTLGSLRSAVAAGADAVEFDVRLTRDGVPVLLHDRTLQRLWGQEAVLASLTYAEVQERTGGGIPTLREALKVMADSPGVRSFIDLPDPAAAEPTVAEVLDSDAAARTYYCGGTAALLTIRAADPDAEIALTCSSPVPYRAGLLRRLRPQWLNYRFGLLDEATVREDHEAGYRVSCWTVDWPRNWRRLTAMGVDAITSNRITGLRRHLGS
ncbi:glycerophosphodiester phosphodiesterase [Streptomyces aculeolatus]